MTPLSTRALLIALMAGLVGAVATANTYTVMSTGNSGAGTLRQAILDANAHAGSDTIAFNITGSGVHTIAPTTPLPTITGPVTIDGETQTGASANTNGPLLGLNTVLRIALYGNNLGAGSVGLHVSSSAVSIKGLSIYAFAGSGLLFDAGAGSIVRGCFIGTMPSGSPGGTQTAGIVVTGANTSVQIGGPTPSLRNLVSGAIESNIVLKQGATDVVILGNLIGLSPDGAHLAAGQPPEQGIDVQGAVGLAIGGAVDGFRNVIAGATNTGILVGTVSGGSDALGTRVENNFIGVDVTGTVALGNDRGIIVRSQHCEVIGNVISGNALLGIQGSSAHYLTVQGNVIGTDPGGNLDLGNGFSGMLVSGDRWIIGGTSPGEENVIAFNGPGSGIRVTSSLATMRGNLFWGNDPLGIDLQGSGVTPNDPGDADTGANGLQNFPIIQSVHPGASTTNVQGTLNSEPSQSYTLDFYAASACPLHPQDFLQAEQYLGATTVTTDAAGNAAFDVDLPVVLTGEPVTATATDPDGNTSELSQRIVLAATPASGSAAGGTVVTLNGMDFLPGATVLVGGVAATNVVVDSVLSLHATIPARTPGSVNAITVLNAGGPSGTLRAGWIADFNDVPPAQQFHAQILDLVAAGVTAGCGTGVYCPLSSVKREQMAVFLLKAGHGVCYAPPPCAGVFTDVPCSSAFAPWIEALADEGITGGCGTGVYCPGNAVTREQMAVFLIKAKFGSGYLPHACAGAFDDVPCPSTYADWIEALADAGITGGCGGGNYCPAQAVRRDQMAAFLGNTFDLH